MHCSRRDGSPFLNLLLVAPLYDNRGAVRYFIGAQIDVTGLMENGRGIESFAKVLDESRQRNQQHLKGEVERETKSALQSLGDLGKMFSTEESAMIQSSSRPSSVRDDASVTDSVAPTVRGRRDPNSRTARRVLGNDDVEEEERSHWGLSSAGPSGRLPGVYQNVRIPSIFIINHPACMLTTPVPSRPPFSFTPHHLRLPRAPHSRPSPIPLPNPHRRSISCSRRSRRRIRLRRRRHRQNHLAPSRPRFGHTRTPTQ